MPNNKRRLTGGSKTKGYAIHMPMIDARLRRVFCFEEENECRALSFILPLARWLTDCISHKLLIGRWLQKFSPVDSVACK
jgi:hypothetical protein